MGRYTGAKGRINRRLATMVYESAGAVRALERRETPPGMYGRRKKMTTYGSAFAEKQKMKHYYGVREAQLRRYFELARKTKGNTGQTLMLLCERRLDNVVRRAGFVHTRPQARARDRAQPFPAQRPDRLDSVDRRECRRRDHGAEPSESAEHVSPGGRIEHVSALRMDLVRTGRPQGDCDFASRFKRHQRPGRYRPDRDLHGTLTFGSSPTIPGC